MQFRFLFHLALSIAAPLWCSVAVAEIQKDTTIHAIDIEAGSLHERLLELANELKVSIFFAKETVEHLHAPAIKGNLTLNQLFEQLFDDKCVEFEFIRERLVALSPGCLEPQTPESPQERIAEQPAPPPAPPPLAIEELVVTETRLTGSRLRQAAYGGAVPLDVIDQTEIRLSGYQAVGELLRYVPAVSGNSTSTLISNGGDGTATITLRGLPASNTLVLLNGRRMNTDALKGSSVDLNTLPLAMVEQIEILKDGASAIYGSDAVAGVVNIITKKDIDGLVVDAYTGDSDEGGLATQNLSFIGGNQGDRWQTVVGINHFDQAGVASRQRELSATSDDRARGGIDKRSSATAPARFSVNGDAFTLSDGAAGVDASDYRPANSEDRFEFRDFTSSIVPSERTSVFGNINWRINDDTDVYGELLYNRTRAEIDLAPAPLFTAFLNNPIEIDAEQSFNPFDATVRDVRRRILEAPIRVQDNMTETARAVTGVKHARGKFYLDLALQFNYTRANEGLLNRFSSAAIGEALSNDCNAPCVPLNVFGPVGSITPEVIDFIQVDAEVDGISKMIALTLDTNWQFRQLNVSSGFEIRQEDLRTSPDTILLNQDLISGGNRGAIQGDRYIIEAYAETLLPLLEDKPFIQRLDMQLATRVSHYSDFGMEINPRLVLRWTMNDQLTLRGSIARGFRAPTLLQLYASQIQSFALLTDPCSEAENVEVFVGCTVQSDINLSQYQLLTGGEQDLEPEVSRTISFGMLWGRQWSNTRITFSADWYRINQRDVVASSAQFIINRNAQFGSFADRVSRNADGNIDLVLATLQNIGERSVSGMDLTFSTITDFKNLGRLTLAINATHIDRFEDKFDPDSPKIDQAGTFRDDASGGLGSLPDWKWNGGISWENKRWQGHYNVYHVSSLKEVVPRVGTTRTISSWTTHNFNMSYRGPELGWTRVTIGVNNLFNESPPFSAAAFNDSYDGRTYDITGRYYFFKLDYAL